VDAGPPLPGAPHSNDEDTSLDAYMRLPVEQYYILDPSTISFLSGSTFVLRVPRLQLLGASLAPVIQVHVQAEQDAVMLQATDCQLNASGVIGGLDDRFAMVFSTRLTWASKLLPAQQGEEQATEAHPETAAASSSSAEQQQQQLQQQQHLPLGQGSVQQQQQYQEQEKKQTSAAASMQQQQQQQPTPTAGVRPAVTLATQQQQLPVRSELSPSLSPSRSSSSSSSSWQRFKQGAAALTGRRGRSSTAAAAAATVASAARGSITGTTQVDVWCEVVPPFQLMPREVLVATVNAVLSGLVNSLLPWFMHELARDYKRWAADPAYRAQRRERTERKQAAEREQQAAGAAAVAAAVPSSASSSAATVTAASGVQVSAAGRPVPAAQRV
jgi:Protein of unknown function (DUF1997)